LSKMKTIAFTGTNGQLTKIAHLSISIPSTNTQHIQECHLAVEHIICDLVERFIFENGDQ
jgi:D-sedoheptulose 7-phosphate isomerase